MKGRRAYIFTAKKDINHSNLTRTKTLPNKFLPQKKLTFYEISLNINSKMLTQKENSTRVVIALYTQEHYFDFVQNKNKFKFGQRSKKLIIF